MNISSAVDAEHVVALSERELALVRTVLERNGVGESNAPVIFGSRATGRARRYSDLDIGFAGEPVPSDALARIEEEFEESELPLRVDVLNLGQADQGLRSHALSAAVPLHLAIGSVA
jgi:predicted nucleotidyltransferase